MTNKSVMTFISVNKISVCLSVKQAGYETIIIAGDLNADPNTLKTQWNKLQYLCGSNYLKTCISEVTRLTATSATTLDQIVNSKNLPICNISISPPLGNSDHN